MTSLVGMINVYTCQTCRHRMVTVDRHEGVTPFSLPCYSGVGKCPGPMYSSFYRVAQDLEPTHEWRKPTALEVAAMPTSHRHHYEQGGLQLYEIGAAVSHSPAGPNRHARRAAASIARRGARFSG